MYIGKKERERIRVVVKLARMQDLEDRSFVVTMHPVGER